MNMAHVLQIPFIPITILLEKKNQNQSLLHMLQLKRWSLVFVGKLHVVVYN